MGPRCNPDRNVRKMIALFAASRPMLVSTSLTRLPLPAKPLKAVNETLMASVIRATATLSMSKARASNASSTYSL